MSGGVEEVVAAPAPAAALVGQRPLDRETEKAKARKRARDLGQMHARGGGGIWLRGVERVVAALAPAAALWGKDRSPAVGRKSARSCEGSLGRAKQRSVKRGQARCGFHVTKARAIPPRDGAGKYRSVVRDLGSMQESARARGVRIIPEGIRGRGGEEAKGEGGRRREGRGD